jgi:hypothetical protein
MKLFGLIAAGLFAGLVLDASLGSRVERAKYRHFRKLEKRSKDAWLARSVARIPKDWER